MKNKLEYRIENGSLIMDNYFNNLKIGSINCGGVESILGKCKLFDEEYVALLKENKQLKDNWNKLKEWVNKNYNYYINNADYIGGRLCFTDMKNNMQKLEQGNDSNVKD